MKKKISILLLLAVLTATMGARCTKGPTKGELEGLTPITLNYWRVWDGPDDFSTIIANYNAMHPNIEIKYRKLRTDEYEMELLNALAEDRGPEIFSINVNQLRQYQSKLTPMPAQIQMTYIVEKGSIKKEKLPELRVSNSITLTKLKDQFVDTVYKDVVLEYENQAKKTKELRIYGLPLAMDTLATFYNKDLLNNAGIADLSDYWQSDKFKQAIKKLTKQDDQGAILQSGMALGLGANIERSADILAVIMMQNGGTIIDDQRRVAFRNTVKGRDVNPGIDAIRFYADFADPTKDNYSWNDQLNNSLEMFMQGRLAVMYGYAYMIPIIKAQAPKLNFSVRKLPQIEGFDTPVNMADYYVEVVSKKTEKKPLVRNAAWDFIQFATTKPEQVKSYLEKTKKVSALRNIIGEQVADNDIGIFAEQMFTARTWYKGLNYHEAIKIFTEMLDAINKSPENFDQELKIMEGRLKQTL